MCCAWVFRYFLDYFQEFQQLQKRRELCSCRTRKKTALGFYQELQTLQVCAHEWPEKALELGIQPAVIPRNAGQCLNIRRLRCISMQPKA